MVARMNKKSCFDLCRLIRDLLTNQEEKREYTEDEEINFTNNLPPTFLEESNLNRQIAMDWFVKMTILYNTPDVFQQAIGIFDRFISAKQYVCPSVGVSLFFSDSLRRNDIRFFTSDRISSRLRKYLKHQLKQMADEIYQTLDHNLAFPLPCNFIKMWLMYFKGREEMSLLCLFLTDLSLVQPLMCIKASKLLAAACCLSSTIVENSYSIIWTKDWKDLTGYNIRDIKSVVNNYIDELKIINEAPQESFVYINYSVGEFKKNIIDEALSRISTKILHLDNNSDETFSNKKEFIDYTEEPFSNEKDLNDNNEEPFSYGRDLNNYTEKPFSYEEDLNNSNEEPFSYEKDLNNNTEEPLSYKKDLNNSSEEPFSYEKDFNNNTEEPLSYKKDLNNSNGEPFPYEKDLKNNTGMPFSYSTENIYLEDRNEEERKKFPEDFLQEHDFSTLNRQKVFDLMVGLTIFETQPQILQQAIYLFDKYVHKKRPCHPELLIAAIMLLISDEMAGYSSMYPMEFLTDNLTQMYTKEQFKQCELDILETLNYDLSIPLPCQFLENCNMILEEDHERNLLSMFLIEIALENYNMCHFEASLIAATACCLSLAIVKKNFNISFIWSLKLIHHTGFSVVDLKPVLVHYIETLDAILDNPGGSSVFEKYSIVKKGNKYINLTVIHSALDSVIMCNNSDLTNEKCFLTTKEIYIEDRIEEESFKLPRDFLKYCNLSPSRRQNIINRLVQATMYDSKPEIFHQAVALFDRYVYTKKKISRYFTFIAIVALSIFNETSIDFFRPAITDPSYLLFASFIKEEMAYLENDIMETLNYNLVFPLPCEFVKRCSMILEVDMECYVLSLFLTDIALLDYKMCHLAPSLLGAAACCLSSAIKEKNFDFALIWTQELADHTLYTVSDLFPVIVQYINALKKIQDNPMESSVYEKYSIHENGREIIDQALSHCNGLDFLFLSISDEQFFDDS